METEVTASAIVDFAKKLEDTSQAFYERLGERFPEIRGLMTSFARESRKNKLLITRTYVETITDALEACFSFKDLRLSEYMPQSLSAEAKHYQESLKSALELEDKALRFYSDVARRCKSLLAAISDVFEVAAETRKRRRSKLDSLLYVKGTP